MLKFIIANPGEHSREELLAIAQMLQSLAGLPAHVAAEVPATPPKPVMLAPPAPPPAPAPEPVAAQPALECGDAAPVALDRDGLPWDARIHASSKTINQTDGLWRAKRGADPETTAEVRAQLGALMAIPAPPAPPQAGGPGTFAELMPLVTAAGLAGSLSAEDFADAWKSAGVSSPLELAARPDLVPGVYAALGGKL